MIQQHFPALTLEEVYGAIAFYLANRDQVDEYLAGQEERWGKLRAEADQDANETVLRLRALRNAKLAAQ
jgi:hypothetical protein